MNYKIAQLIISPGNKSSSLCDIYIGQPDSSKEKLAGKLFVVLEIESEKADAIKILNFIIDNLSYTYYQNEKIILQEKISALKTEHIFESALAKTNANFEDFIKNEKIKINYEKINITASLIQDNNLYFSNSGKNRICLIYKNKKSREENNYNFFDLAKEDEKEIKHNKLFSNVISGRLPAGSSLVIANEALPEYISKNQLIGIISKLPPASAVEHIKSLLSGINAYIPFLALIIKSSMLKNNLYEEESLSDAKDSIYRLNIMEDNTEKLLSPSGLVNFKKWLKPPFNKLFPAFKKEKSAQKNIAIKEKIVVKRKSFLSLKKIFNILKNLTFNLVNILFYFFKLLTSKDKLFSIFNRIYGRLKKGLKNFFAFLIGLNNKKKILAFIFIALLIIFVFNVGSKTQKKDHEARQTKIDGLIKDFEQKHNQIEAFLLYNNEDGAKKSFNELGDLIETILEEGLAEEIDNFAAHQEKYLDYQNSFRKIEKFSELEELADFNNLNLNAEALNIVLFEEKNKIFAGDTKQKSIYILDLKTKTVTTAMDIGDTLKSLAAGVKLDDLIYYFNYDGFIAFSSINEEIKNFPISQAQENYDINSIDIYNSRLYALDPKQSQIYRYDRSGNGFSAPRLWIKDQIDLADAVDISIDGHIYVLERSGQIIKLLSGEKQNLLLDEVDPPLTNAVKLFVSTGQKFIYILETGSQRLVVYDKTGKFLMQYQDDRLSNLKDFKIDEKNKIIYLLNENSVYQASGTHFAL